jgi:hypothetical protein
MPMFDHSHDLTTDGIYEDCKYKMRSKINLEKLIVAQLTNKLSDFF